MGSFHSFWPISEVSPQLKIVKVFNTDDTSEVKWSLNVPPS